MAMWNPWRGCEKCSDGCLHCYIHKGDAKRKINTNEIVKTKDFYKPIETSEPTISKCANSSVPISVSNPFETSSGIVYLCFVTDFFIE